MCHGRWVARKRIQPPFRSALKKNSPGLPILDEKDIRMKFKNHILVRCKMMNGGKTFG
jgi:hypothetical protein